MVGSVCQRRRAVCLASLVVSVCVGVCGSEAPRQATPPSSSQAKADVPGTSLPAPYGRHTDDFDAMVKRGNIRALVLINPIGFFYDNGKPMGIMYDALEALQAHVNQRLKARAIKVEVTFVPV